MGEVYAAHDLFLLTSAFEGLPLSMLEAMGQGCVPVVADLASGISEVIQHGVNGFRCPQGDAAAYARCLRTLHDAHEVREQMALRAWETVEARFRLETMADRYVSLFGQMLSRGFVRPGGRIEPGPSMARTELLPGPLQSFGHRVKSLAPFGRR